MKPMLAATVDNLNDLVYPLYGSPKLDGVRAVVYDGQLLSRNLKPIRNLHVQRNLPLGELEGLDGELIVGSPTAKDCFRVTSSGVMSEEGEPKFVFYVFDRDMRGHFSVRYRAVKDHLFMIGCQWKTKLPLQVVPHVLLHSAFEAAEYEEAMLDKGYEGIMLRCPQGPYKYGRSTLREAYLMKLKRFMDSEAEILEVIELQHNQNEQVRDALGRSKRSTHKAGKVAGGKMGALRVRDIHSGVEFELGSGFTEYDRNQYWKRRTQKPGTIVKYKYFPTGAKEKPRFPVWLGERKD